MSEQIKCYLFPKHRTSVTILGSLWNIYEKLLTEDDQLNYANGYCDFTNRTIVLRSDFESESCVSNLRVFKEKVLRHELIHAFLCESGLLSNSDWATSEEMVDWFAIQIPKIVESLNKIT